MTFNMPSTVVSLGTNVFSFCTNLPSLSLSTNITGIGDETFYGCTALNNPGGVTIPISINTIGDSAFYGCSNLTIIGFPAPSSLTNLGSSAFSHCFKLMNFPMPNTVASVGTNAFSYCTNLSAFSLSTNLTSIGAFMFYDCTGLTSITIPTTSHLTTIGDSAFYGCSKFYGISIPSSVTTLGNSAFFGCNFTNFTLPASIKTIGTNAFANCTSLVNFAFAVNGAVAIPGGMFSGCTRLASILIPSIIVSLGDAAFQGCSSLTNLTFLGSAPGLGGPNVFQNDHAIVYYFPETANWGPTYGGLTTVMVIPQIDTATASVRGLPNGFSFTITGINNQIAVIQASPDLIHWQPIQTNTIIGASSNFSDPQWTNYPTRFYRIAPQ
jgi:hypothetical protein